MQDQLVELRNVIARIATEQRLGCFAPSPEAVVGHHSPLVLLKEEMEDRP